MKREGLRQIPDDQRLINDSDVFAAFDLSRPELSAVSAALKTDRLSLAKQELVHYFENRKTPFYYYDYRALPLIPIDTDSNPYVFQAALGLQGSLKKFCLYAGRKLMDHIYVRPGGELEFSLGDNYEQMPHFNYPEDQEKCHRTVMDIFVRGQIFEYLAVLYHETGDRAVIEEFLRLYRAFSLTYPLKIEESCIAEGRFSMREERDIMSTGFLALSLIGLFYTRLPYEIPCEEAFEILKSIWFLGIQFRRFDHAPYRDYNHHLWEKGLVPYILSVMFPEIPDFAWMNETGMQVINRHIEGDFNTHGGYSEHSISYWGGAAMGEMLCRGIFLARLNNLLLLNPSNIERIERTASALALIAPPGEKYPAVGDGGGLSVNPILMNGIRATGSRISGQVMDIRRGTEDGQSDKPILDFCDTFCGFACSRDTYASDGNYFLMSVKQNCGESGHNHMDMLSMDIFFRGKEIIGEPYARAIYHKVKMGTENRGYLYNMSSHNSVLAYGKPVVPDRCFANKWGVYRPDSPVDVFWSMEKGVYLEAHHDAYGFCRHKRRVMFHRKKGFLINDEIMRGNRMPEPHIQRWNLMPGVSCIQLDRDTVLLQKGEVKILCMWSGTPQIRLWKKEDLCPEIIGKPEELGMIMDVSFSGYHQTKGDLASVSQNMIMVDATKNVPDRIYWEDLLRTAAFPQIKAEAEELLEKF